MTRNVTGNIFDIQRFSIHDGPGIRTTVFTKGCPLQCVWCHNPEGIDAAPVLSFLPRKCIGCGYCVRTCPRGAHKIIDDVHELDRAACEACGRCTDECYAGALELVGREITVGEALDVVLRDRPFYETSGGVVLRDGYIYGSASSRGGKWYCVELKTGKVMWEAKIVRNGSSVLADGLFYCYGDRGTVALAQMSPEGHKVVSSFKITKGGGDHWAHMAISDGRLYVRHGEVLMAYHIKDPKAAGPAAAR